MATNRNAHDNEAILLAKRATFVQFVASYLLALYDHRESREFTARELELFTDSQAQKRGKGYAFGTASRLLRKLQAEGVVDYEVLDREGSRYRLTRIDAEKSVEIISHNGKGR